MNVFLRRIAPLALAILMPAGLRAEPYMAVRYGYACSQCHVNPTGGGQRNSFGMSFSQTILPARTVGVGDVARLGRWLRPAPSVQGPDASGATEGASPPPSSPGLRSTYIDGHITEFLSAGADFRFALRSTFPQSGSPTTSFDLTEGDIYGSAGFLDGLFTLYLDERVAPGGASAREAFALIRGPAGSYVKGGRILLPYGIRLQDDSAFIREATGFNFGVQDLGIEAGIEPGPFTASFAISNGTAGRSDDNRDKQVTGMVGLIRENWRIGAQGTWNNGTSARRGAFGANAGLTLGRFTLLGEADYMMDEVFGPDGATTRTILLYGEVDYLLARGINLKFTYDYDWPDTAVSRTAFTRIGGGIEIFPTQFTQVRLLAYYRDEADKSGKIDTTLVTLEFHLFF